MGDTLSRLMTEISMEVDSRGVSRESNSAPLRREFLRDLYTSSRVTENRMAQRAEANLRPSGITLISEGHNVIAGESR